MSRSAVSEPKPSRDQVSPTPFRSAVSRVVAIVHGASKIIYLKVELKSSSPEGRTRQLFDMCRQLSLQERETFLQVAIERIIVGEDSLDIRIGVGALTDLLLERSAKDSLPDAKAIRSQGSTVSVSLTCALQTKRQGRDLRLVLAANQQSFVRPSLPLIKAVVRANSWLERLLSGEILSLEELVSETGFTKRYVSRTLRSAFLAPDITEAILDGVQTPDLTVRNLMGGLPIDWSTQRTALMASTNDGQALG
jgi:hypothetical protein